MKTLPLQLFYCRPRLKLVTSAALHYDGRVVSIHLNDGRWRRRRRAKGRAGIETVVGGVDIGISIKLAQAPRPAGSGSRGSVPSSGVACVVYHRSRHCRRMELL